MPRYLISFDDGSMDYIPDEDWPAPTHGRPGPRHEGSHRRVRDHRGAVAGGALDWAARFARCGRCAQEVREIMYDPAS